MRRTLSRTFQVQQWNGSLRLKTGFCLQQQADFRSLYRNRSFAKKCNLRLSVHFGHPKIPKNSSKVAASRPSAPGDESLMENGSLHQGEGKLLVTAHSGAFISFHLH